MLQQDMMDRANMHLLSKNEVDAIAKGTSQNYGNQDWYEEATRNFALKVDTTLLFMEEPTME